MGGKRLLSTGAVEEFEGLFLDGRRARGDGEGDARRGGDFDGVFGERGEVGDQGLEAVDGQAVRLVTAAGERSALATTEGRSASAVSLSSPESCAAGRYSDDLRQSIGEIGAELSGLARHEKNTARPANAATDLIDRNIRIFPGPRGSGFFP